MPRKKRAASASAKYGANNTSYKAIGFYIYQECPETMKKKTPGNEW
jgi:hypothetical protein